MKKDIIQKLEELKGKNLHSESWMEKGEKDLLSHISSNPMPNLDVSDNGSVMDSVKESPNGHKMTGDFGIFNQAQMGLLENFKSLSSMVQASAVIGIVAVLGGGVSAVASGSLPGDALYGWKLGVNERVGSVLAIGAENQAEYELKLLDRRFKDLIYVNSKSDINVQVQIDAQERYNHQLEIVQKSLDEISEPDAKSNIDQKFIEFESKVQNEIKTNSNSGIKLDGTAEVKAEVKVEGSMEVKSSPEPTSKPNDSVAPSSGPSPSPSSSPSSSGSVEGKGSGGLNIGM